MPKGWRPVDTRSRATERGARLNECPVPSGQRTSASKHRFIARRNRRNSPHVRRFSGMRVLLALLISTVLASLAHAALPWPDAMVVSSLLLPARQAGAAV